MKTASLGDFLLWWGQPAKIIGETDRRQVIIELLEPSRCPHCEGDLGKTQIHVVVSSPLFQEGAKPLQTITDDPTLVVS